MARFRSIKPEFWTNAQVLECAFVTRLFFIGIWNFCDDEGRHLVSLKQLKARIFPADDFDSENIRRMIDELYLHGLIRLYRVDDIEYLEVTGWHHQKIDKKQQSKLPSSLDSRAVQINSTTVRRMFALEREEREESKEIIKKKNKSKEKELAVIAPMTLTSDLIEWGAKQPQCWTQDEMKQFLDFYLDYYNNLAANKRPKDWQSQFRNSVRKNWMGVKRAKEFKTYRDRLEAHNQDVVSEFLKMTGEGNDEHTKFIGND